VTRGNQARTLPLLPPSPSSLYGNSICGPIRKLLPFSYWSPTHYPPPPPPHQPITNTGFPSVTNVTTKGIEIWIAERQHYTSRKNSFFCRFYNPNAQGSPLLTTDGSGSGTAKAASAKENQRHFLLDKQF
jgi:hypothetical protein